MTGPSYKLKQALDSTIGTLDTECDVVCASPTEDEVIFVIRTFAPEPMTRAHLKRIHNRFIALVAEEFAISDDFETFEEHGDSD